MGTNSQMIVIDQHFSNVIRDNSRIFVAVGDKLKVVKDSYMTFHRLNSPVIQLCEEDDDLVNYQEFLSEQIGFWDWKSYFIDFRTRKCYIVEVDGTPNQEPLKFVETDEEYLKQPKEKCTHIELIHQKIKVSQDDRNEVPFLAV